MIEIWRPWGNDERYSVSNKGRIRGPRKLLKPVLQSIGYYTISHRKFGTVSIHRMVAETFLEGNGETVNHKNGIKTDNRLENLEWMSMADNCRHAFDAGLTKTRRPIVIDGNSYCGVNAARRAGVSWREIYP